MRRVVVTGLGMVSPVGNTVKESWENAVAGRSGIGKVTLIDLSQEPVQIGGEVKNFVASQFMSEKDASRSQRFTHFAVAASKMALQDAGLTIDESNDVDVGVSIGVGVGGMKLTEDQSQNLATKGSRFVSPFTIPGLIANMAAGTVSIETGAKGPNICPTTACTSGTHAVGEGLMLIQTGRAKVMIAGGAEAAISGISFAGFSRMQALTKEFNDCPEKASRPFDLNRSGFVFGEGAGVLILEDYEFAKARGARIYCELAGYGMSGDAFHMTMPSPGGAGAVRCMEQALKTGGVNPSEVDYVNAHGTSTKANDELESAAMRTVFKDHAYKMNISSTKSVTGHLLGAAGGVEAVFSVMALHTGICPPTINYTTPDPACDLNYTPNEAVKRDIRVVMSNSFGFGGTNGTVVFKKLT